MGDTRCGRGGRVLLALGLAAGAMLLRGEEAGASGGVGLWGLTNEVVELPTIVVTATRMEEERFSVPYAVSVVGAVDFGRKLPRTTVETLRELPSVMLQKTGHGQGSPYLRGFTGFRTLMLVDGIRLNNSTFRDGPNQYWNTIDAQALERVEVVRGPGSVMYGSDAIGGTVQAISKGREGYGDGFDANGGVAYRYASAEASGMGRSEISVQQDGRVGLQAGASLKEFGELRGGREVGRQPATDYGEWDVDVKADYWLTPSSRLVYGHQTVRLEDAWRTHSTVYGVLWEGTTRGSDQRRVFDQGRDLDFVQYHATQLPGFAEVVQVSVSRHFQGEEEDRVRGSGSREIQTVEVQTLGLTTSLESPSSVGRWVYGVEYYHDWVDSSYRGYDAQGSPTTVRVQGPVADDARYDLAGVFAEDRLDLVADRLELRLGGRFTYAGADANRVRDPASGATVSLEDSWDSLVGSGRLLWQLDPAGRVAAYVGASQGFRAPNLSDLTRFDADAGQQETPAFGLEPEEFLSAEAGVRLRAGVLGVEAAYYRTFMDDLIVRVQTGQVTSNGDVVVAKQNSGEGYVQGVEVAGEVHLHRDWVLWGNLTWMEGELETPAMEGGPLRTEPVSRLMPLTANAGLRWQHRTGRVWAECAATVAEEQDRLSASDRLDTQRIPPGGTPGYAVCHLRLGWNPWPRVQLSAALENLTDEDYRIHGSGVNEPGRNFILNAGIRF